MVDGTLYQLLLLFLLFYFFLIRPEMKKAKAHQAMLDGLKKGDKIVTRGGLYAVITKTENESDLTAEIADGVIITLNKAGILALADTDVKPAKAVSKTDTKTKKTKK